LTECFHGTYPEYLAGLNGSSGGLLEGIAKDIPRGATCIDVGANIGATALYLAVARPDCKVIAIEPIPDNVRCLRQNIATNGISNITVLEAAASNNRDLIPMASSGPYSSFTPGSSLLCPTIMLDDFAGQNVAFVKIDTEGFEPNVLDGARALLDRDKPLVLAEFNSWWMMVHGYNPIAVSTALFNSFDILGFYHLDALSPLPSQTIGIAHTNIMEHKCISDVLMRPRAPLPAFAAMVGR
jgi:FkbM family methyltransferase